MPKNYSENTSNKVLTHEMVAKEAAAMLVEESQFIKAINRNREKEFNKDTQGYKKGDTVRIRVPPTPIVTEGHVFKSADANENAQEKSVNLTIDTQKHVGLEFGAAELTLNMTDFKSRFLQPAINSLATSIDADLLQRAIVTVNNMTSMQASEAHPTAAWGRARTMMNRALAPSSDRMSMLSSELTNKIVDPAGTLFNPTAEIAKQWKEGYIGRSRGFEFVESEHIYRQSTGSHGKTGMTVEGASQTGGTLTVGGITDGQTIKRGEVFTIEGVEQIHPVTHQTYQAPLQFVVLEDVTAGGTTATLKIYPEITPATVASQLKANATTLSSPANSAAITFVMDSDALVEQALCFQKDAFAAAFAPLEKLPGTEGYVFNGSTMALRVMSGGDFTNDTKGTRVDVLYGFAAIRGNHAARVLAPTA
ncbi:P22 phage major capsid protein family protein [Psychrobacter celer]|uniref:P22 phage major capsid protein family protein n=1 Tax=Psychrobacter celer TaxID=306572 RepID=UPI003FD68D6F